MSLCGTQEEMVDFQRDSPGPQIPPLRHIEVPDSEAEATAEVPGAEATTASRLTYPRSQSI